MSEFSIFIKNITYLIAGVIGATGISHEAIIVLGILMIIDVITGVAKSGKIGGWVSITSSRCVSGVIAKLLVMLVPLTISLAGIGTGIDLKFISSSSLSILILAEAYSILGNIHSAVTGKKSPEIDAIGFILSKFREVVENFLNSSKK